jgi:hypothetical protein
VSGEGLLCFVCGLILVPGNNVLRVERDGAMRWSHGHHAIVAPTWDVQRGRLAAKTVFTLEPEA